MSDIERGNPELKASPESTKSAGGIPNHKPWVALRSRPRLIASSWTGVLFSSLNR